jgi:hypothetical protein
MNKQIKARQGERATADAIMATHIQKNVNLDELARAHGHYISHIHSPAEHLRSEYIGIRDELFVLLNRSPSERVRQSLRIRQLKRSLADIPLVLRDIDSFPNLVTTGGKNDALDKYLAGSAYTAAWYIGLIGSASYTTGPAVGDTAASHGGWVESQDYSQGARPTTAWSAASAGSKALSSNLTYSINGSVTEKGGFLISNSTKGGTTGILYSAGLFTGGDKILGNGDTLSLSYAASL